MDRFTALGFARAYGVYHAPTGAPLGLPRARWGDALWREVEQYARRVAAFGWGAL